jgi:hypothetical protein
MPYKSPVQRISTIFSDEDFSKLKTYAKRKGLSMYALAKKAILEFVERHP